MKSDPVDAAIEAMERPRKPMMACGHSANATDGYGNPTCVICVCTTKDKEARTIVPMPDFSNRRATCSYGMHAIVASSTELAFFEYHPDREYDEYYCGCHGWD